MTWIPIDDKERPAPRDETFVMLFTPWSESGVTIAFWSEAFRHWYESECSSRAVDDGWDKVTHYMPLPPPPEEGGE